MDSSFYRTSLRRIHNCTEPDIPEETLFDWVFYAADLAILETSATLAESSSIQRIEGKLEALLASSRKYPPARVLAAQALEGAKLDWPLLAERMERLLIHYFQTQASSGFCLLRCLEDQGDSLEMGGYGGVDHYYWVLANDGEKLTWVSDQDYLIHRAPVGEFEVPTECKLPLSLPIGFEGRPSD